VDTVATRRVVTTKLSAIPLMSIGKNYNVKSSIRTFLECAYQTPLIEKGKKIHKDMPK